jgi:threonyl-tRNA synthetase
MSNQPMDHREVNQDLQVFTTDPLAGAGLPLWLPNGAVIRAEVEAFAREIAQADGCVGVYSPVLGKRALFERSGHWAKFSDDMFPPMPVGGDELVLRPANCPHHALIYAASRHSYRELPVRLHELGAMFRAERSGVLSGLGRVREIHLDDTHVFCRPDQVGVEAARALRSVLRAQAVLGLPIDHVRLSRRGDGDGYLGDDEAWRRAEQALADAAGEVGLVEQGLDLVDVRGEAAFYGPKLDVQVVGSRGHEETIATVQIDFTQPERFDLTYDDADGERKRVVMIHRGTIGSMERVVAALLDRYAGRLPLWLAPVQLCVLPVSPEVDEAARELVDEARAAGVRVRHEVDGSLGSRIRASRQRRDCVMAVVGRQELERREIKVVDPGAGFEGAVARDELVPLLRSAYSARAAVSWPGAP